MDILVRLVQGEKKYDDRSEGDSTTGVVGRGYPGIG